MDLISSSETEVFTAHDLVIYALKFLLQEELPEVSLPDSSFAFGFLETEFCLKINIIIVLSCVIF